VRIKELRINSTHPNNMDSVSTYSEARNEYLKQLSTWIVPYMIQFYRNLWTVASREGGQRRAMVVFQEKCAEVPKWNQDLIDENVGKLLDNCRCDYLEELMAAVFIAHTKVLIAVRVSSKHKKLQITLPKLDHFIHRIFSECARSFWKAPYLFLDDEKPIEMQKNLLQAEALCNESIASAVRSLLPIKNILNEYLSEDVMSSEPVIEEGSADVEPVVKKETEAAATAEAEAQAEEESKPKSPAPKSPRSGAASPAAAPSSPVKGGAEKAEKTAEPVAENDDESEKEKSTETVESADISNNAVPAEVALFDLNTEDRFNENSVKVTKLDGGAEPEVASASASASAPEPEELVIPSENVHFNDYDSVLDPNLNQSFQFVPKDTSDDSPMLIINEDTVQPLSADASVTNLEAPGVNKENSSVEVDEILD